jgi:hypothetical protein
VEEEEKEKEEEEEEAEEEEEGVWQVSSPTDRWPRLIVSKKHTCVCAELSVGRTVV